jgi:uncharacterized membrane protein
MIDLLRRPGAAHLFLAQRSFYPLALASALACGLLLSRVWMFRSPRYGFLLWNLLLAWVPYLCSLWAASLRRRPSAHWRLLLPATLWLAFLPNAPYLLTDLMHLGWADPPGWWYDVGLLVSFAWAGCFLAVASLRIMQRLVDQLAGRLAGRLLVAAAALLCGLGVYLGRFLRWNSWDLLLNPRAVLADVAVMLADPLAHPRTLGVTLMFGALTLVCYLTFTGMTEGTARD